jgi:hypothetical protein
MQFGRSELQSNVVAVFMLHQRRQNGHCRARPSVRVICLGAQICRHFAKANYGPFLARVSAIGRMIDVSGTSASARTSDSRPTLPEVRKVLNAEVPRHRAERAMTYGGVGHVTSENSPSKVAASGTPLANFKPRSDPSFRGPPGSGPFPRGPAPMQCLGRSS